MAKFVALLGAMSLLGFGFATERKPTIADALKNIRVLAIPANGRPIDRTVADEFHRDLAPQAEIKTPGQAGRNEKGVMRIAIADEEFLTGPTPDALRESGGKSWMFLKLAPDGSGELTTSAPHLLYAL